MAKLRATTSGQSCKGHLPKISNAIMFIVKHENRCSWRLFETIRNCAQVKTSGELRLLCKGIVQVNKPIVSSGSKAVQIKVSAPQAILGILVPE